MSKELITKAEEIRDEVRVGANTSKRVGGFLEEIAREVNGLYENVLDWINNEKPQGGGFILTQSDVVNSLADESELKPLSAKQGKILKAIIDALVVDNLVTNDETKALSAKQGKNLADDIRGLSEVYQPLGDYAADVHTHNASDIQEETNKKFMTDTERNVLSILGTKAARIYDQKSLPNGYRKYEDGLMIQWGFVTTSGQKTRTVYMPASYLNDSYKVFFGIEVGDIEVVQTLYISNKTTTRFYVVGEFYKPLTGVHGHPGESFNWFAIGFWK